MAIDQDDPLPVPSLLARPLLEPMGVAELEAYLEGLRAEIVRVEAEIGRKARLRDAADSVFRFR